MSIDLLFTPQTLTGANAFSEGSAIDGATGKADVFAHRNFMELLLKLALQNEEDNAQSKDLDIAEDQTHNASLDTLLKSSHPELDEEAKLDVAELLSATPEIEEDLKQLSKILDLSPQEQIDFALKLNQAVFDKLLNPDALAQETHELILEKRSLEEDLQNQAMAEDALRSLLAGIQNLDDIDISELSYATPAQLSVLQAEIQQQIALKVQSQAIQDHSFEDTEQEVLQQVYAALAPALNILSKFLGAPEDITALPVSLTKATHDLSSADQIIEATNLIVGANNSSNVEIDSLIAYPAAANATPANGSSQEQDLSAFDRLLLALTDKTTTAETEQIITQLKNVRPNNAPTHALPVIEAIVTHANEGLSSFSFNSFDPSLEPINFNALPVNISQAAGSSITNGMISNYVPATQMVAITMQKIGLNAQDRSFTLQLDPPELGRVEVRMSFDKNKTVKALLTIEKPETYAMLQRDAQSLERAMQEIGLDADGALDFQLAQDNHDFNQDGRHDGSRNATSSSQDAAEDDLEIIETTMNWHVDPETGHMRYDILV